MKVSIIWTDDTGQLVLHPETEYEKDILRHVIQANDSIEIKKNVRVFECANDFLRVDSADHNDLALVFRHQETCKEKSEK